MKETDAEKSLRGKNGFVTDERKCLSLVHGAFQGLCAIVGPAGRRLLQGLKPAYRRTFPTTDPLEPPGPQTTH